MLTQAQLQKIWLLSDTVLYPEAISFIHNLVEEQDCDPLPASQVSGLLSIAESSNYDELFRFVVHQRDRDWPPSRRDIKTFYTALEEVFSLMRRKRLKDEFHLIAKGQGKSASELRQESDELMALLSREFIQHLVAENGLLTVAAADQRAKQRANERAKQNPNRR
jgi:hypothetical protein